MSTRTPSKRLAALFLLALVGVLVLIGVALAEFVGPVAVGLYAAVVLALVVAGAVVVRRRTPPPAPARDHSACSCCAGSSGVGVEVV